MTLGLEIAIAGIALAGVIATGFFNLLELYLERRKKKEHEQHQTQLIEIKNYIKSCSSDDSESSRNLEPAIMEPIESKQKKSNRLFFVFGNRNT